MKHVRISFDEVLEIAIRIERNGADFYRKAAAGRQADQERVFLLELASMEEEHERTFRAMRDKFSNIQDRNAPEMDEESVLYLDAMADYHGGEGHIPAADRLKGSESLADIVAMAIDLELKSILYYDGLRLLAPPDLGGERIDLIISEERRHVAVLRRELRRITAA